MEVLLLKLLAFFRPIFFIESKWTVAGLNLFEFIAILSFAALVAAFLSNTAQRQRLRLSLVDVCIVAFTLWCGAAFLVYLDRSYTNDLAKLIIPLFTYIIAKNIISTREQYLNILYWMMLGFLIPLVLSTASILGGSGLDRVNYWTGIPRYEGLYANSHNMGHNAAFALMLIAVYTLLYKLVFDNRRLPKTTVVLIATIGVAAAFCLYESRVRTSIVGVLVFAAVYFAYFNRKLLIVGAVGLVVAAIMFAPVLVPTLLHDVQKVQEGEWEAEDIASGRPQIWGHNLKIFVSLPLDRQLAGVGIGNRTSQTEGRFSPDGVLNSHNDFLEVLMQTGLVGMALFLWLQVVVLRRLIQLPTAERRLFFSVFVAVMVMNMISNSYVIRFGLAQMYYLLLCYIELPRIAGTTVRASTIPGMDRKADSYRHA